MNVREGRFVVHNVRKRTRGSMLLGNAVALVAALLMSLVAPSQAEPPNFGSPPSGEITVLYNDHHVYIKPAMLKHGRVLLAAFKGSGFVVPLQSLLDQIQQATISYDPGASTIRVTQPGSDLCGSEFALRNTTTVSMTLGKHEMIVNGESRQLDVPPEMYKGYVLVPLRAIVEVFWAYLDWVPSRHQVVVRYIPGDPVCPPLETTPPTPIPSPTTP